MYATVIPVFAPGLLRERALDVTIATVRRAQLLRGVGRMRLIKRRKSDLGGLRAGLRGPSTWASLRPVPPRAATRVCRGIAAGRQVPGSGELPENIRDARERWQ